MCRSTILTITITFSEYSTTSLILRGYPDTRYVLAVGDIFISSISTSVTVLLDNMPKSCISENNARLKINTIIIIRSMTKHSESNKYNISNQPECIQF